MIGILDYGAGNLRSVQNTLGAIGAEYTLVHDAAGLQHPDGVPFLGICLGLQALFDGSDEAPEHRGLGLFPGLIRRFSNDARVPHMGWNEIVPKSGSKLLHGVATQPYLYFAHSYYAPLNEATAATCTYTVPYTAVLESGNIHGVQFHPEKSGPLGLRIVRNFVERC